MKMLEEVAKALDAVEFRLRGVWEPQADVHTDWRTIRARLMELEAENERLRDDLADADERSQVRSCERTSAIMRAEKAEALLREAVEWNWLDDDAPRPDVMDVLEQRITAHLSENKP